MISWYFLALLQPSITVHPLFLLSTTWWRCSSPQTDSVCPAVNSMSFHILDRAHFVPFYQHVRIQHDNLWVSACRIEVTFTSFMKSIILFLSEVWKVTHLGVGRQVSYQPDASLHLLLLLLRPHPARRPSSSGSFTFQITNVQQQQMFVAPWGRVCDCLRLYLSRIELTSDFTAL